MARDVIFSTTRSKLRKKFADDEKSNSENKFKKSFLTTTAACLLAAPANEVRGFYLQDPAAAAGEQKDRKKFFKFKKFIVSSFLGSLTTGLSSAISEAVVQNIIEKKKSKDLPLKL